jgi:N-acetylmuramoyl-L-alanine amidase
MKVFISPGHGGKDNGAAWGGKYDYVEEDDLNLIISFLLRYELLLAGHEVKMARETDTYVALLERCKMANIWRADIFVSIHADAFHNVIAKGISTHVYTNCSAEALILATWIHSKLITNFIDHTDRGVKKSNFHVLRNTKMPAALIECEFISNLLMRRFLKEPENQIKIARAVAEGIEKYDIIRRK